MAAKKDFEKNDTVTTTTGFVRPGVDEYYQDTAKSDTLHRGLKPRHISVSRSPPFNVGS